MSLMRRIRAYRVLRALQSDLSRCIISVRDESGRYIVGPMTLDQLRLSIKYGGYSEQHEETIGAISLSMGWRK